MSNNTRKEFTDILFGDQSEFAIVVSNIVSSLYRKLIEPRKSHL